MIVAALEWAGYTVGPDAPPANAVVTSGLITAWDHPTDPKPDEATLIAQYEADPTGLAADKRRDIETDARAQIPSFTDVQLQEDSSQKWLTRRGVLRNKALLEKLAQTADEDLDQFSSSLEDYPMSEQDYALFILEQDTETVIRDDAVVAANNNDPDKGILSPEAKNRTKSRIVKNRNVADGLESGVDTPSTGDDRQFVVLDGEGTATAIFWVDSPYEWPAGTPRYLARCQLSDISEGIVTTNVWLRIYENDGTPVNGVPADQNWLPFEEQPDGTWLTPGIVNYDALAKSAETTLRCAVAYLGSQSESEVTRRTAVVPPHTAGPVRVRWGGRNGEPQARGRGRGRRR